MARPESTRPEREKLEPIVPESVAQLDAVCGRRDLLMRKLALLAEEVAGTKLEVEAIDQGIGIYIERHRHWWYPSKKSLLELPKSKAIIRRILADPSLVMPPDCNENLLAEQMAQSEEDKIYVIFKPTLDKKALAKAPLSVLKRYGLQVRKHWSYSLRTPGMSRAVQLLRIPYRARRTATS